MPNKDIQNNIASSKDIVRIESEFRNIREQGC